MADIIPNIQNTEPISTKPVQPTEDATSQSLAASANKTKKDFSLDTKIGSLNELRAKAPEVYKQMMLGIAQNIIKRMREHQGRLKRMMRKG